jgi:hypothetical protein
MADDRPTVLIAGDRSRRPPEPLPGRLVLASRFRAPRLVAAGHAVCIASPTALPFRTASLGGARVERRLPRDLLPAVVTECTRALGPAGTLSLEADVRYGSTGAGRWLAARLVGSPPPGPPEVIARLLLEAGFERIEQQLDGGRARFRARRLPGRSASSGNSPLV